MRIPTALAVLLASIWLVGCGGDSGPLRLPTIPVKGKLTVDGKPYGPCLLTFGNLTDDPDTEKAKARGQTIAKVSADGTFVLTTYQEGDGGFPGNYQVTLSGHRSDATAPMSPYPVCKPATVEIAKSADGKPVEITVSLDSTGETTGNMVNMPKTGGKGP